MGQVNVTIAGRIYRMACDDGEEDHLGRLAERLDGKITDFRAHFGEIGDQRVTVMAALTVADDLSAAERRIEALQARITELEERERHADARLEGVYGGVAEALGGAAHRIERIARSLDALPRE